MILGRRDKSQRRRDATKDKVQILSHGALDFVMLGDLRGVAHLERPYWRAFARRTSARSGAATELLGQSLHSELQRNLFALQLEDSPLQGLDRLLQLFQLVVMPIRTSPRSFESPSDALVKRE